jgi:hypothetical protein
VALNTIIQTIVKHVIEQRNNQLLNIESDGLARRNTFLMRQTVILLIISVKQMDTKIKTVKLLRISLIILYFRAINSNPLNCDCEMRAFRQSIYARQGNLLVMSATCAGTTIKMTDAQDSQFGSCTGMYDM